MNFLVGVALGCLVILVVQSIFFKNKKFTKLFQDLPCGTYRIVGFYESPWHTIYAIVEPFWLQVQLVVIDNYGVKIREREVCSWESVTQNLIPEEVYIYKNNNGKKKCIVYFVKLINSTSSVAS